ncbi:MAG: glycosyltransferase family 4 protein [Syntrophotaleaceae bacterium]
MTLLHIIESLSGYGGTPRKLMYLAKYANHKVCRHIFLCYMPSPLRDEFEQCGAIVECLDTTSVIEIIRKSVELSRKYTVDSICTHFTRPLLIGFVTASYKNLPIIHNEHSSASYRKGVGRYISRFILPRIEKITCNSHYTKESVHREFAVPHKKMEVLHNPVEKRLCNRDKSDLRRQFGFGKNDIVIGHVGGMIPQRDQKTLILAFSKLKKTLPHARLIMIGDGSLRGQLEELVTQLGITESVKFTGYTDKIGEYLNAMDIYVNPTLDEGFGIAVVEAMLESLPVVLADKGAHPELIENGISGVLYRGGDSQALLQKLETLAKSPELRVRMGILANERAVAKFHPSVYASSYLSVATEVVDSFRSSNQGRMRARE